MVHPVSPWANAPFLRLFLCLFLGVTIPFPAIQLSIFPVLGVFCFILVLLVGLRNAHFSYQPYWGALLLFAIVLLGTFRLKQESMDFPALTSQSYFAVLEDFPIQKEKTYQVTAQFVNKNQKILAYLTKNQLVQNAQPGDILFFYGQPELVENDGNPFEFDYRKYLNSKKIGYRIFLKEGQFFFLKNESQRNIFHQALIFRAKLVECLDRSGISPKNVHLIASISFGARDEVDKETIQSFTNTGVIHVLAVSGMNVGLVFIILNFLFGFLTKFRFGLFLHTIIMLSGIWGYTLIAGMCASILRAALMFTFVVVGTTLQRKSNIFNSLSVSAFFLVAFQPSMIGDVGFQLSYAAVVSIVVIHPIIYRQFFFRNWLSNQIWLMISVTIAAQIGTVPFTFHYFHQFPVYFWLANLMVIPLVTLILYLSLVVVFVSYISTFLTTLFAFVLDKSVDLVLLIVNAVEGLPHSVLKNLYPSFIQLILTFIIVYLLYKHIKTRNFRLLQGGLLLVLILATTIGFISYKEWSRSEIVFFNIQNTRALVVNTNREAVVLYDRCERPEEKIGYSLKPYCGERGIKAIQMVKLSDSLRIDNLGLCVIGQYIHFGGIRLFVEPNIELKLNHTTKTLAADVVWLSNSKDTYPNVLSFNDSQILIDCQRKKQEVAKPGNPRQKYFKLTKSVLLDCKVPFRGKSSQISCGYFNDID